MIRHAISRDIPDLRCLFTELLGHEITDEAVANRLRMVEESPSDELYVFERDAKILGVLGFRIRENVEEPSRFGEVSVLVTSPDSRHLGIGRLLMEFAERRAHELGCKGTRLVSGFGREEEVHHFYKKLGYQITGYRFVKNILGDIGDAP